MKFVPIRCTPVLLYLPFTPNSSPFKTSMEILDPAMRGSSFWWDSFSGGRGP